MGNVNGRDDVNGTPSGTEGEEEEAGEEGGSDSVADCMSSNPGHRAPSELMGHSPPASPRATQSPFMFTPQVNSPFFFCLPFIHKWDIFLSSISVQIVKKKIIFFYICSSLKLLMFGVSKRLKQKSKRFGSTSPRTHDA